MGVRGKPLWVTHHQFCSHSCTSSEQKILILLVRIAYRSLVQRAAQFKAQHYFSDTLTYN